MNTEKYISNIKEKVNKKIESLRSEANEAYNNWADTGYQRYMAKYERLLKEADELEAFIHPEIKRRYYSAENRKLRDENESLRMLLKTVQNIVEMEIKYSFPDCSETRRLEDIVSQFKHDYAKK